MLRAKTEELNISRIEFGAYMFDPKEYSSLPEDEQYKQVYAYFGLLVYIFQLLEHQLLNMILIINKVKNKSMPVDTYNKLFYDYSGKTMKGLLNPIMRTYQISKPHRRELEDVICKRNYIVHHYFKDNIFKTYTLNGRIEMIIEFEKTTNRVKAIDEVMGLYTKEHLATMGLTDEVLVKTMQETIKRGEDSSDLKFCK